MEEMRPNEEKWKWKHVPARAIPQFESKRMQVWKLFCLPSLDIDGIRKIDHNESAFATTRYYILKCGDLSTV